MANFTTHIGAGTVQAGVLATLTLAADVVAPENLVAVTLAGVLGSVLPDIDLKDSRASKMMFAGLAVFSSFVVLFAFAEKYSVVELMVLWLGTLVSVRYGLHLLFLRLSVSRVFAASRARRNLFGRCHEPAHKIVVRYSTQVVRFAISRRFDSDGCCGGFGALHDTTCKNLLGRNHAALTLGRPQSTLIAGSQ
mgnify:CR=1 FL=1